MLTSHRMIKTMNVLEMQTKSTLDKSYFFTTERFWCTEQSILKVITVQAQICFYENGFRQCRGVS